MKFICQISYGIILIINAGCAMQYANTEHQPASKSEQKKPSKHISEGVLQEKSLPRSFSKESKFSKLKYGMTLKQVEKLVGAPTKQWQRPTNKAAIPYYFGPDRWEIKYLYEGEALLTFNEGGEQILISVESDRQE